MSLKNLEIFKKDPFINDDISSDPPTTPNATIIPTTNLCSAKSAAAATTTTEQPPPTIASLTIKDIDFARSSDSGKSSSCSPTLLDCSFDSGIAGVMLDSDDMQLPKRIQQCQRILLALERDREKFRCIRNRLSKITDRRKKQATDNENFCNVCCAEIDPEDAKTFVKCYICHKHICRSIKCADWLAKTAQWECELCQTSKESLAQTSSWVADQISFHQEKSVYPMRARSEIFIPISECNDSSIHFESVSQIGANSAIVTAEQKLKIREYVEEVVANLLGGNLDTISVNQLSKSENYLPAPKTNGHLKQNGSITTTNNDATRDVTAISTNSPDFTDISEIRLRQMIQKIIAETINMPLLSTQHAVSEISLDRRSKTTDNMSLTNGHRYRTEHYFEPKIYQDLLATAVLNKIVDKQLNNHGMLESSSDLTRGDGGGGGDDGGGNSGGAVLDQNFNLENQSTTSGSSVEPRSDCSFTDMEQLINANDDKTTDLLISAGRESVMSDYLASHMVPLPDLSTMATESEEDDYMSVTSSAIGDGTWENNWLFKKKKPTLGGNVAASSVGMLVPDPKEDVRAQIGDKTADEVSDLSELGSDTDDSLDILRTQLDPINDRLINKHLIGGQNNKLVLDELIERSSMISNTLPTDMEQAYTETCNEHLIDASTKTEAINADVNQQNNNNATEEREEPEVLLPPAGFEDSNSNPLSAGDDFSESDGCTGFSTVEILEPDVRTPSVVEILAAMALGPMLAVPAIDQPAALTVTEFEALTELKDLALAEIKVRSLELTPHSLSVIPEEPGEHIIDLKNFPTPDEISEGIIDDFEKGLITAIDFSNLVMDAEQNETNQSNDCISEENYISEQAIILQTISENVQETSIDLEAILKKQNFPVCVSKHMDENPSQLTESKTTESQTQISTNELSPTPPECQPSEVETTIVVSTEIIESSCENLQKETVILETSAPFSANAVKDILDTLIDAAVLDDQISEIKTSANSIETLNEFSEHPSALASTTTSENIDTSEPISDLPTTQECLTANIDDKVLDCFELTKCLKSDEKFTSALTEDNSTQSLISENIDESPLEKSTYSDKAITESKGSKTIDSSESNTQEVLIIKEKSESLTTKESEINDYINLKSDLSFNQPSSQQEEDKGCETISKTSDKQFSAPDENNCNMEEYTSEQKNYQINPTDQPSPSIFEDKLPENASFECLQQAEHKINQNVEGSSTTAQPAEKANDKIPEYIPMLEDESLSKTKPPNENCTETPPSNECLADKASPMESLNSKTQHSDKSNAAPTDNDIYEIATSECSECDKQNIDQSIIHFQTSYKSSELTKTDYILLEDNKKLESSTHVKESITESTYCEKKTSEDSKSEIPLSPEVLTKEIITETETLEGSECTTKPKEDGLEPSTKMDELHEADGSVCSPLQEDNKIFETDAEPYKQIVEKYDPTLIEEDVYETATSEGSETDTQHTSEFSPDQILIKLLKAESESIEPSTNTRLFETECISFDTPPLLECEVEVLLSETIPSGRDNVSTLLTNDKIPNEADFTAPTVDSAYSKTTSDELTSAILKSKLTEYPTPVPQDEQVSQMPIEQHTGIIDANQFTIIEESNLTPIKDEGLNALPTKSKIQTTEECCANLEENLITNTCSKTGSRENLTDIEISETTPLECTPFVVSEQNSSVTVIENSISKIQPCDKNILSEISETQSREYSISVPPGCVLPAGEAAVELTKTLTKNEISKTLELTIETETENVISDSQPTMEIIRPIEHAFDSEKPSETTFSEALKLSKEEISEAQPKETSILNDTDNKIHESVPSGVLPSIEEHAIDETEKIIGNTIPQLTALTNSESITLSNQQPFMSPANEHISETISLECTSSETDSSNVSAVMVAELETKSSADTISNSETLPDIKSTICNPPAEHLECFEHSFDNATPLKVESTISVKENEILDASLIEESVLADMDNIAETASSECSSCVIEPVLKLTSKLTDNLSIAETTNTVTESSQEIHEVSTLTLFLNEDHIEPPASVDTEDQIFETVAVDCSASAIESAQKLQETQCTEHTISVSKAILLSEMVPSIDTPLMKTVETQPVEEYISVNTIEDITETVSSKCLESEVHSTACLTENTFCTDAEPLKQLEHPTIALLSVSDNKDENVSETKSLEITVFTGEENDILDTQATKDYNSVDNGKEFDKTTTLTILKSVTNLAVEPILPPPDVKSINQPNEHTSMLTIAKTNLTEEEKLSETVSADETTASLPEHIVVETVAPTKSIIQSSERCTSVDMDGKFAMDDTDPADVTSAAITKCANLNPEPTEIITVDKDITISQTTHFEPSNIADNVIIKVLSTESAPSECTNSKSEALDVNTSTVADIKIIDSRRTEELISPDNDIKRTKTLYSECVFTKTEPVDKSIEVLETLDPANKDSTSQPSVLSTTVFTDKNISQIETSECINPEQENTVSNAQHIEKSLPTGTDQNNMETGRLECLGSVTEPAEESVATLIENTTASLTENTILENTMIVPSQPVEQGTSDAKKFDLKDTESTLLTASDKSIEISQENLILENLPAKDIEYIRQNSDQSMSIPSEENVSKLTLLESSMELMQPIEASVALETENNILDAQPSKDLISRPNSEILECSTYVANPAGELKEMTLTDTEHLVNEESYSQPPNQSTPEPLNEQIPETLLQNSLEFTTVTVKENTTLNFQPIEESVLADKAITLSETEILTNEITISQLSRQSITASSCEQISEITSIQTTSSAFGTMEVHTVNITDNITPDFHPISMDTDKRISGPKPISELTIKSTENETENTLIENNVKPLNQPSEQSIPLSVDELSGLEAVDVSSVAVEEKASITELTVKSTETLTENTLVENKVKSLNQPSEESIPLSVDELSGLEPVDVSFVAVEENASNKQPDKEYSPTDTNSKTDHLPNATSGTQVSVNEKIPEIATISHTMSETKPTEASTLKAIEITSSKLQPSDESISICADKQISETECLECLTSATNPADESTVCLKENTSTETDNEVISQPAGHSIPVFTDEEIPKNTFIECAISEIEPATPDAQPDQKYVSVDNVNTIFETADKSITGITENIVLKTVLSSNAESLSIPLEHVIPVPSTEYIPEPAPLESTTDSINAISNIQPLEESLSGDMDNKVSTTACSQCLTFVKYATGESADSTISSTECLSNVESSCQPLNLSNAEQLNELKSVIQPSELIENTTSDFESIEESILSCSDKLISETACLESLTSVKESAEEDIASLTESTIKETNMKHISQPFEQITLVCTAEKLSEIKFLECTLSEKKPIKLSTVTVPENDTYNESAIAERAYSTDVESANMTSYGNLSDIEHSACTMDAIKVTSTLTEIVPLNEQISEESVFKETNDKVYENAYLECSTPATCQAEESTEIILSETEPLTNAKSSSETFEQSISVPSEILSLDRTMDIEPIHVSTNMEAESLPEYVPIEETDPLKNAESISEPFKQSIPVLSDEQISELSSFHRTTASIEPINVSTIEETDNCENRQLEAEPIIETKPIIEAECRSDFSMPFIPVSSDEQINVVSSLGSTMYIIEPTDVTTIAETANSLTEISSLDCTTSITEPIDISTIGETEHSIPETKKIVETEILREPFKQSIPVSSEKQITEISSLDCTTSIIEPIDVSSLAETGNSLPETEPVLEKQPLTNTERNSESYKQSVPVLSDEQIFEMSSINRTTSSIESKDESTIAETDNSTIAKTDSLLSNIEPIVETEPLKNAEFDSDRFIKESIPVPSDKQITEPIDASTILETDNSLPEPEQIEGTEPFTNVECNSDIPVSSDEHITVITSLNCTMSVLKPTDVSTLAETDNSHPETEPFTNAECSSEPMKQSIPVPSDEQMSEISSLNSTSSIEPIEVSQIAKIDKSLLATERIIECSSEHLKQSIPVSLDEQISELPSPDRTTSIPAETENSLLETETITSTEYSSNNLKQSIPVSSDEQITLVSSLDSTMFNRPADVSKIMETDNSLPEMSSLDCTMSNIETIDVPEITEIDYSLPETETGVETEILSEPFKQSIPISPNEQITEISSLDCTMCIKDPIDLPAIPETDNLLPESETIVETESFKNADTASEPFPQPISVPSEEPIDASTIAETDNSLPELQQIVETEPFRNEECSNENFKQSIPASSDKSLDCTMSIIESINLCKTEKTDNSLLGTEPVIEKEPLTNAECSSEHLKQSSDEQITVVSSLDSTMSIIEPTDVTTNAETGYSLPEISSFNCSKSITETKDISSIAETDHSLLEAKTIAETELLSEPFKQSISLPETEPIIETEQSIPVSSDEQITEVSSLDSTMSIIEPTDVTSNAETGISLSEISSLNCTTSITETEDISSNAETGHSLLETKTIVETEILSEPFKQSISVSSDEHMSKISSLDCTISIIEPIAISTIAETDNSLPETEPIIETEPLTNSEYSSVAFKKSIPVPLDEQVMDISSSDRIEPIDLSTIADIANPLPKTRSIEEIEPMKNAESGSEPLKQSFSVSSDIQHTTCSVEPKDASTIAKTDNSLPETEPNIEIEPLKNSESDSDQLKQYISVHSDEQISEISAAYCPTSSTEPIDVSTIPETDNSVLETEQNVETEPLKNTDSISKPIKQSVPVPSDEQITKISSLNCIIEPVVISTIAETDILLPQSHPVLETEPFKNAESACEPFKEYIPVPSDEQISESSSLDCTLSVLEPIDVFTIVVTDNTTANTEILTEKSLSADKENKNTEKISENISLKSTLSVIKNSEIENPNPQISELFISAETDENISETAASECLSSLSENRMEICTMLTKQYISQAEPTTVVEDVCKSTEKNVASLKCTEVTREKEVLETPIPKTQTAEECIFEVSSGNISISKLKNLTSLITEPADSPPLEDPADDEMSKTSPSTIPSAENESVVSIVTSTNNVTSEAQLNEESLLVDKNNKISEIEPTECLPSVTEPPIINATLTERTTESQHLTNLEYMKQSAEKNDSEEQILETLPSESPPSVTEPEVIPVVSSVANVTSETQPTIQAHSEAGPSECLAALIEPIIPSATLRENRISELPHLTDTKYVPQCSEQHIQELSNQQISKTAPLKHKTSVTETETGEHSIETTSSLAENISTETAPSKQSIQEPSENPLVECTTFEDSTTTLVEEIILSSQATEDSVSVDSKSNISNIATELAIKPISTITENTITENTISETEAIEKLQCTLAQPSISMQTENATLSTQSAEEFVLVRTDLQISKTASSESLSTVKAPQHPTSLLTENTISNATDQTPFDQKTPESDTFAIETLEETDNKVTEKAISYTQAVEYTFETSPLEFLSSVTESTVECLISVPEPTVSPDSKLKSQEKPSDAENIAVERVEISSEAVTENSISENKADEESILVESDNQISETSTFGTCDQPNENIIKTIQTELINEPWELTVELLEPLSSKLKDLTDSENTILCTEKSVAVSTDNSIFESVEHSLSAIEHTKQPNLILTKETDENIIKNPPTECSTSEKVPVEELSIAENKVSVTHITEESVLVPTDNNISKSVVLTSLEIITEPSIQLISANTDDKDSQILAKESTEVADISTDSDSLTSSKLTLVVKDDNSSKLLPSESFGIQLTGEATSAIFAHTGPECLTHKDLEAIIQHTDESVAIQTNELLTEALPLGYALADATIPEASPLVDSENMCQPTEKPICSSTTQESHPTEDKQTPQIVNKAEEETILTFEGVEEDNKNIVLVISTNKKTSSQESVQLETSLVIEDPDLTSPGINLKIEILDESSPDQSSVATEIHSAVTSEVIQEVSTALYTAEATQDDDFNRDESRSDAVSIVSEPKELILPSEPEVSENSVKASSLTDSITITVLDSLAQSIVRAITDTHAQDAPLTKTTAPHVIIQPVAAEVFTDQSQDNEVLEKNLTHISTDEQVSIDETTSPSITRQPTVVEIEPKVDESLKDKISQATDSVTTAQSLGNSNVLRKLQRQYRVEDTTPSFEDECQQQQLQQSQPPNATTKNSLANLCQKYINDKHLLAALEKRRRQTLLMHKFLSTVDSFQSDNNSVEEETIELDTEVQTQIVDHPPPPPTPVVCDQDSDDDCSDSFNIKVNEQNTMISYNFINNILFSDQLSYDSNQFDGDSRNNTVEEYIENETNDEKDILVNKFNNTTTTITQLTTTTNTNTNSNIRKTNDNHHQRISINGTASSTKPTIQKRSKRQSNKSLTLTSADQNPPPYYPSPSSTRQHIKKSRHIEELTSSYDDDTEVEILIEEDDDDDDDEVAMLRHFVPGSIAEREYKKWYNAVEMPNNPYAPEALKRRISGSQERFIDLPNISPIKEQNPLELLSQDKLDADETDKRESDYRRYSRDYYINNSTPSSQTSTPRETPATPTKDNLENTKSIISSPTKTETGNDLYKAIPAQVVEDSTSSIDTISQQSTNSGNVTTSDDSDTIKIYDFKKQETTVLKDATKDIKPKERPTVLNFSRSESAGNVTTPTRGCTPTAFKFLQPKRKLLDPSQVLSVDDEAPELRSPMDKPVIEQEVAEALPSVKALAKAFLMTTKSSQSENRWVRKAKTLSHGETSKLPTPVASLDPTPLEPAKVEEDVTITSDLSSLETDSSLAYKDTENTKDIPKTPLSPTADSTISADNSPVPVRQGGLKSNIAFFENLKFK